MTNHNAGAADESYTMAQHFAASGRYADAILAYSSAIEGEPGNVKARCGRGMASQRMGEHSKAIADFDAVISGYPDWPGIFVAYYSRAASRQALGQKLGAIEDCGEAIRRNPGCTDALYLRGTALKPLGDVEAATKGIDAVLTADPNYWEAYLVRGQLSFLQQRWELAIRDLTGAIEHMVPGSVSAHECYYLRGMVAQELGDHRLAIADFTRTIDLIPDQGPAYLRRSRSYREIGEAALADADFKRGIPMEHGRRDTT